MESKNEDNDENSEKNQSNGENKINNVHNDNSIEILEPSNHKSISDRSRVIFGILKLGIWSIGILIASHNIESLQEYWSYVSSAQLPQLCHHSIEKSIIIW